MHQDQEVKENKETRVLLVCHGNSCRSPMAAAIANGNLGLQGDNFLFDSAGGKVLFGEKFKKTAKASKFAIEAVKSLNLRDANDQPINMDNYKPKPLTKKLLDEFDVVLFLGDGLLNAATKRYEGTEYKKKLGLYAPNSKYYGSGGKMVPDPFDLDAFTVEMISKVQRKGDEKGTQYDYDLVAGIIRDEFTPDLKNVIEQVQGVSINRSIIVDSNINNPIKFGDDFKNAAGALRDANCRLSHDEVKEDENNNFFKPIVNKAPNAERSR